MQVGLFLPENAQTWFPKRKSDNHRPQKRRKKSRRPVLFIKIQSQKKSWFIRKFRDLNCLISSEKVCSILTDFD